MTILNIVLTVFLVITFFYAFYLISELEDLREHLEITAVRFDTQLRKATILCDKLEELGKKISEDVYCLDITEDKVYEHFKEIHEYVKGLKEKGDDLK